MINRIAMAPLNAKDECLWLNDYCSNLHPVKFLPAKALFYIDVHLYDRVCTKHSAKPSLDQLITSSDHDNFINQLYSMQEGDLIRGRFTLRRGLDSKIAYMLNRGFVDNDAAITGVFYDVSMIDALRGQLVSMDNLIMLGQLSAGILHDVGNHIMTVSAMASAISNMTEDARIKQYAEDIVQCMDSCGQITNHSKGIAKSNIDKFVRVNIWDLMLGITNMLQGTFKNKYKISIKTTSEYYYVLGDEYLLQNAILNVILNARDAMPNGGSITINISDDGNMLMLAIKDTGIGMEDNVKSRIFEPFFTTKSNHGTGIGLARCKSTIESHNGIIEVNSTPGKGSEFILKLPLLR